MPDIDADQTLRERAMVAITVFIAALAVGALWSLLTLPRPWLFDPLTVVAAVVLALMLRKTAPRGMYAAILAALGTLLAAGYASCLSASARLSNELGLPLAEVLQANGLRGAVHFGYLSLHARDLAWLLVAALIAFGLTLLPTRRPA